MDVISTVTSPVFSELVFLLEEDTIARLPLDDDLFETIRAMYEVRSFELVFFLVVSNPFRVEARQRLVGALGFVTENGFCNHALVSRSRSPRLRRHHVHFLHYKYL